MSKITTGARSITILVSAEDHAALAGVAARQALTVTAVVRQIVEAYLSAPRAVDTPEKGV